MDDTAFVIFRAFRSVRPGGTGSRPVCSGEKENRRRPSGAFSGFAAQSAIVAAITALMVCMRFSASSNTMDCGPSKTSSVTSMQSMPNFS